MSHILEHFRLSEVAYHHRRFHANRAAAGIRFQSALRFSGFHASYGQHMTGVLNLFTSPISEHFQSSTHLDAINHYGHHSCHFKVTIISLLARCSTFVHPNYLRTLSPFGFLWNRFLLILAPKMGARKLASPLCFRVLNGIFSGFRFGSRFDASKDGSRAAFGCLLAAFCRFWTARRRPRASFGMFYTCSSQEF